MPQLFVFNDEQVTNSYGFRTENAGIGLLRFRANPVMLDGHWADTENVIGKWQQVGLVDGKLCGEPVFDVADEKASNIAGKVERGFLNACSMGLVFDPADMVREPDNSWTLKKCELLEVSIVAVPSNANAVRLYRQQDGAVQLLSEAEVKLCLTAKTDKIEIDIKTEKTMKKVILSVAALVALGLDKNANAVEGVEETVLSEAINGLKSKLDQSEQKLNASNLALKTLQDAALEQRKLAADKLVNDAITAGKIDATAKDEWVALAMSNEKLATATLGALPGKQSLAAQVNNPATATTDTMKEFQKMTVAQQLAFKAENPEAFKKMVAGM